MKNLVINIHGFLASPEAEKIVGFRKHIHESYGNVDLISPLVPDKPEKAVALIEGLIKDNKNGYRNIALIGHSLGGYYATYIATKYQLRAVLVNPVVRGYEIMCEFFGECYNPHTESKFEITERDIDFLCGIHLETLSDTNLFYVMQQLGDEINEPEQVLAYYKGCKMLVEEDGCHDFSGFAKHTQDIIKFLFG